MNKKWIYSALNCEAYSSFEGVSFDQRIVTGKIRLTRRRNATQTIKTIHYDWFLLNNRYFSNKYTLTLRKKCDALQEKSETLIPNDEYENFVNAHMEATAECIPTKLRAKHRALWEISTVKKKRDNVKTASLSNKRNPNNANAQNFKKSQRELTNAYQKEQIEYIHGQINKIWNSVEDR